MDIKNENYNDLRHHHYTGTRASEVADFLNRTRSAHAYEQVYKVFPDADELTKSAAILFSPIADLLKFYSLLEISLIIRFIPEPDYDDEHWKQVRDDLNMPLIGGYAERGYPVVLPQFLLARLEGRLHLEEENLEESYSDACALFLSFISLISRWRYADVEAFLRFAISSENDRAQYETFAGLIRDRNEFLSRALPPRSRVSHRDQLIHGFCQVVELCEDLDRLLEEAGSFPLLQSAMWNYHADLFTLLGSRLPSYLIELVAGFRQWTDTDMAPEDMGIIHGEVRRITSLIERLSSGAYGSLLSGITLEPITAAPARR